MGIEPTLSAWEAEVLPLNYTRQLHSSVRCMLPDFFSLSCGNFEQEFL